MMMKKEDHHTADRQLVDEAYQHRRRQRPLSAVEVMTMDTREYLAWLIEMDALEALCRRLEMGAPHSGESETTKKRTTILDRRDLTTIRMTIEQTKV